MLKVSRFAEQRKKKIKKGKYLRREIDEGRSNVVGAVWLLVVSLN